MTQTRQECTPRAVHLCWLLLTDLQRLTVEGVPRIEQTGGCRASIEISMVWRLELPVIEQQIKVRKKCFSFLPELIIFSEKTPKAETHSNKQSNMSGRKGKRTYGVNGGTCLNL